MDGIRVKRVGQSEATAEAAKCKGIHFFFFALSSGRFRSLISASHATQPWGERNTEPNLTHVEHCTVLLFSLAA